MGLLLLRAPRSVNYKCHCCQCDRSGGANDQQGEHTGWHGVVYSLTFLKVNTSVWVTLTAMYLSSKLRFTQSTLSDIKSRRTPAFAPKALHVETQIGFRRCMTSTRCGGKVGARIDKIAKMRWHFQHYKRSLEITRLEVTDDRTCRYADGEYTVADRHCRMLQGVQHFTKEKFEWPANVLDKSCILLYVGEYIKCFASFAARFGCHKRLEGLLARTVEMRILRVRYCCVQAY